MGRISLNLLNHKSFLMTQGYIPREQYHVPLQPSSSQSESTPRQTCRANVLTYRPLGRFKHTKICKLRKVNNLSRQVRDRGLDSHQDRGVFINISQVYFNTFLFKNLFSFLISFDVHPQFFHVFCFLQIITSKIFPSSTESIINQQIINKNKITIIINKIIGKLTNTTLNCRLIKEGFKI